MRLSQDEFVSKFVDEMLGMALLPRPMDEHGHGIFVRTRLTKVEDILRRMYNSLAPVPATLPSEPPPNGTHGLTFKPQVKK